MKGRKQSQDGAVACVMTVEETAEKMGTTPATVRKLERRALKKLRMALEKLGFHSAKDARARISSATAAGFAIAHEGSLSGLQRGS